MTHARQFGHWRACVFFDCRRFDQGTGIMIKTEPVMDVARTTSSSTAVQIAEHPFMKGLSAEQITRLSACAMDSHFAAGEIIFLEGDPANRFYLIQAGRVALESRPSGSEAVVIGEIGPGDVLGWSWLLPPYLWHFDARAIEPVSAIFLYGTRLREECEEDHDLGYELMKRTAEVIIQRLQSTRQRLQAALSRAKG